MGIGWIRNLIEAGKMAGIFGAVFLFTACSAPVGSLFYGTLAKGNPVIIVLSGAAGGPQAVVAYDTNGNFLENLSDLTYPNLTPVGVAPKDGFSFVVALGQAGVTGSLNLFQTIGGYSSWVTNTNLNGALYQMGYHKNSGTYFIIKANTVEGFTNQGDRVLSPVIPTTITTGSNTCTLAAPKALSIDQVNNKLWVVNTAATVQLLVYDISNVNAVTCAGVNTSMGATAPLPVLVHDNGYVYSVSQTTHKLWAFSQTAPTTAGTAVYTDTPGTLLSTSTALAEMPDGTILIANAGTKQIDHFQVNGLSAATRVGSSAFIKDVFSTQVNDIMILKGL